MVDSPAQLDVVDAVLPPGQRENIRVCLELDASWNSRRPRPHRRAAFSGARRRCRGLPRPVHRGSRRLHPRGNDGLRGADRRSRRQARRQAARRSGEALDAVAVHRGAARPPRGCSRSRPAHRRPRVRQRRRHRLAGVDPRGRLRHRDRCRQRHLRRPPVRQLQPLHAGARRILRHVDRASAGAGHRHHPRWRLDRVRTPGPGPPAEDRLARRALDGTARVRRRGADPRQRAGGADPPAPATGCGCATPSPASSPST